MYTYKRSAGRYKVYTPGYHLVDISQYSVADLEKLFDILYIVIDDSMYNSEVCIRLEDYKLDFAKNPQLNIDGWLKTKESEVLITTTDIPGDKYRYVKLERVFTYGYFHYPADLNLANDRQDQLLSDSAPDIRLAHYHYQNIDYNRINDYSLWTVNGVFTRGVGRKDGVYLMGAGGDYIANRNDIRIGALNFQMLGKVKTVPIDKAKLVEVDLSSGKRWQYELDQPITDKVVYLVVNGQLMVDDSTVYRVADNRVVINLNNFDVVHHYLNYKKYTRTPKLTNLTKFDKYKREALEKHNSFLVIIDNPTLGIDVTPLTTFHYPNNLHTEERFQHPIVLDNGMFPVPYIKTYGIHQRLLSHDLRVYNKYPFMSNGTLGNQELYDPVVNQGDPGHLSKGYMFKIHGLQFRKGS